VGDFPAGRFWGLDPAWVCRSRHSGFARLGLISKGLGDGCWWPAELARPALIRLRMRRFAGSTVGGPWAGSPVGSLSCAGGPWMEVRVGRFAQATEGAGWLLHRWPIPACRSGCWPSLAVRCRLGRSDTRVAAFCREVFGPPCSWSPWRLWHEQGIKAEVLCSCVAWGGRGVSETAAPPRGRPSRRPGAGALFPPPGVTGPGRFAPPCRGEKKNRPCWRPTASRPWRSGLAR